MWPQAGARSNATFVNNATCDDACGNEPDNGDLYAMTAQIDDAACAPSPPPVPTQAPSKGTEPVSDAVSDAVSDSVSVSDSDSDSMFPSMLGVPVYCFPEARRKRKKKSSIVPLVWERRRR